MVFTARCVVVNFVNTSRSSDCKFYRFPKVVWKQEQRNKWIIDNCRKEKKSRWHPKPDDRICSAHFIGGRKTDEQASPSYVPRIKTNQDGLTKMRQYRGSNVIWNEETCTKSRKDVYVQQPQLVDLAGVTLNNFNFLLKTTQINYMVSEKDRLLLFLMKIKLGVTFSALSVLFGIHRTTVSRIFCPYVEEIAAV
ncbi:uncharacterized protein LOC134659840 [Cydia amplana]|uniref:uncharacterized protein LOC134659840 n=1 Tax=Cydia amplana TaxID=1869771 RepID=UPI002FE5D803